MPLFRTYKFYLMDGHKFDVLACNIIEAVKDACDLEQIQEYEIRLIEVVE